MRTAQRLPRDRPALPNLPACLQDWANNCWFEHSQYAYGENVAVGQPSLDAAALEWYRCDRGGKEISSGVLGLEGR